MSNLYKFELLKNEYLYIFYLVGLSLIFFMLGDYFLVLLIILFNFIIVVMKTKVKIGIILMNVILMTIYYSNFDFYNVFPQALELIGKPPLELIRFNHPHSLRYLLIYPIFESAIEFNKDYNVLYTLVNIIYLFLIVIILIKLVRLFSRVANLKLSILAVIIPLMSIISISFIMNGRLIPAYLGFTVIIYSQVLMYSSSKCISTSRILLQWIMVVFTSVSSGTIIVGFLQVLLGNIIIMFKNKQKKTIIKISLISILFIVLYKDFIFIGLNKNISFFMGEYKSIFSIFGHGIIGIFKDLFLLKVSIFTGIVIIFIFVFQRLHKIAGIGILFLAILLTMFGSLFGISTGTLVIVPSITFVALFVASKKGDERK